MYIYIYVGIICVCMYVCMYICITLYIYVYIHVVHNIIQVACKVTGRCIEMMGGIGFVKNFPVEKFYRDTKIGK